MINLDELKLSDILPERLKTSEILAITNALDKELQAITTSIEEIIIMPKIDQMPEHIVDELAWQLHVDFYEPLGLSLDKKRTLVKNSLIWHRQKGTKSAVEALVYTLFGEGFAVEEWFEYGGEPYFFRIRLTHDFALASDTTEHLLPAINTLKNKRSWLEGFFIQFHFKNQNRLNFASLSMGHFLFQNITSPRLLNGRHLLNGSWVLGIGAIHGKNFINFRAMATIRNYGLIGEGVLLNGRNLIDGSFFLNGQKYAPLRAITSRHLALGVYRWLNNFKATSALFFFASRLENRNNFSARNFALKARVRNYGLIGEGVLLDGQRIIGGAFFLNGRKYAPLRAISAKQLEMGVYRWLNNFNTTSGLFSLTSRLSNASHFKASVFATKASIINQSGNLSTKRLNLGKYRSKNTNQLGQASLTSTSGWILDGKLRLDGVQTLKKVTKEVFLN